MLKVEYKSIQSPKHDEVLVRMLTKPINPSDIIPIRGSYAHRIALPNTPGYEGVGIVEDVGSSVSQALIGKRVLPLRGEGTWQDYVKTTASFAVPIPSSIDDCTASQLYINPITAWVVCTEQLQLTANDILLVNACSSAIGRIFAQLSQVLGFRLMALTRNDKYTSELLELGASYVINTAKDSAYETVMTLTNGIGANAAIDCIGGSVGNDLAFCVQPGGSFISLGLLSGEQVNWAEITKKAKVNAKLFHLRQWNNKASIEAWQETFHRLIALINNQQLTLMSPGSYYDLSEVKKAVNAVIYSNGNRGKVFLKS